MRRFPDPKLTLDELDPPAWGEPEFDSYLVTTSHQLRKKPIGELTVEDLRLMIGQGVGARFLVPYALRVLEDDLLAEGDFYPGDLLAAVLKLEADFWTREHEWRDWLSSLLEVPSEMPEDLVGAVESFLADVTQRSS